MKNDAIRQQILMAAEARFKQYGYKKTGMIELAQDCNMSAANLYRHFENKLDICAVLAKQCLAEVEVLLEQIVVDNQLSAKDKLVAFVSQQLHHTHHYFESVPKIGELVEAMTIQRPEVIEVHRQHKLALLRQLLLQGQASGAFAFDDVNEMSDAIHSATILFYFPLTVSLYPLPVLEKN
jgi:AcrR family transcriptional regulator